MVRALTPGGFDLDDIGTELGQEACGKGTGPETRQVDYPVTGQRTVLPTMARADPGGLSGAHAQRRTDESIREEDIVGLHLRMRHPLLEGAAFGHGRWGKE